MATIGMVDELSPDGEAILDRRGGRGEGRPRVLRIWTLTSECGSQFFKIDSKHLQLAYCMFPVLALAMITELRLCFRIRCQTAKKWYERFVRFPNWTEFPCARFTEEFGGHLEVVQGMAVVNRLVGAEQTIYPVSRPCLD